MITCFYINLNEAVNRRKDLERSFYNLKTAPFCLERIEATDKNAVRGPETQIRRTDRAVNRSHLEALKRAQQNKKISMIMEDDTFLFRETFAILDTVIKNLDPENPIIIFTDVMITTPNGIVQFQNIYQPKKLQLIDLSQVQYAGASCYILTPAALNRVLYYAQSNLDLRPWDMTLRSLIHTEKLKGRVITPFITSVSEHADKSSNQPGDLQDTDFIWNTFRRSISLHPEFFDLANARKYIASTYDTDQFETMTQVIAAHASHKFRKK
jgi:GR25 family glycosyltransferase involved in LPS biosynthesis